MRDGKPGTVRDLRRENRAAVLWSLFLGPSRSRHEVSAATGLSAASVTNVIRELIDEGIVIETGLAESDGGRPRAMLGMNPDCGYVIGVDIGETRTRVELFDLAMTERAKAEYPLNRSAEHDVDVVVGQIVSGLNAVLRDSGIDQDAILGVGVSGKGARSAVVVLIGSGVGASLISGGATYRGATSSAAEFGHVTVVVGGRKCRCGSTGCLEAYAGAEAILERYGRPMAADDQELALAELIDAAGTSRLAAAILDETGQYLGAGIGTLVNLFNPERVILGGWAGLLLGGRVLPSIRQSARQHSLRHPFAATSIELGRLGPGAVALGAATLPLESFLNRATYHRPNGSSAAIATTTNSRVR